jgi:hypothetical protein
MEESATSIFRFSGLKMEAIVSSETLLVHQINTLAHTSLYKPFLLLISPTFFPGLHVISHEWHAQIVVSRRLYLVYVSLSFLLPPLWSIGHPWNASFHVSSLILRQLVGLLGRGFGPSQGLYLYKHRINTDKHPCCEWDSNPRSQGWIRRRQLCSIYLHSKYQCPQNIHDTLK